MAKHITDNHATLAIKKKVERVGRQEYLDYMTFKANRRPPFTEIFGPILGLKEEWAAQGATQEELDMSCYRYRDGHFGHLPAWTGWMGGCEERIVEETDEHIIGIDRRGRHVKLAKKAATLPLPMDYPVKTMQDWLNIKHHYEFSEERFGKGWEQAARDIAAADSLVAVNIPGGFDEPRELMGEEHLCIAYYEQPELVHDILQTIAETAHRVLDRVSATVKIDALFVHEDMAGKGGPLAGPRQVLEFIKPYYRRVWDLLQSRGARLFYQDSDGDMNGIIPAMIESGVNFMYPMEPAAGMDIVAVRRKYGKLLAVMGGIDKHVIRRSRAEITAELEYKIPPMVATGGCVLALDHRIPNGTPLDSYKFYVDEAWRIIDREAAKLPKLD